jgi:hypothetical protein
MSESSTKEHLPTREELDREARRLARIRHLRVVPDPSDSEALEQQVAYWHERDPDPKNAA